MTEKAKPAMFDWAELDVCVEGGEIKRVQAMVPQFRFVPLCQRQYEIGESYALVPFEYRSTASHRHLFASIGSVWENLPEEWVARMPTPEHLRKWMLVQVGHADHSQFVLDTAKDALLFARGLRRFDQYAVIKVSGNVVDVWVARSLSRQSVPTKEEFQRIKDDMLRGLELIGGNSRAEIEHEGRTRALPAPRSGR